MCKYRVSLHTVFTRRTQSCTACDMRETHNLCFRAYTRLRCVVSVSTTFRPTKYILNAKITQRRYLSTTQCHRMLRNGMENVSKTHVHKVPPRCPVRTTCEGRERRGRPDRPTPLVPPRIHTLCVFVVCVCVCVECGCSSSCGEGV